MAVGIVVVGANGRMGRMLCDLAQNTSGCDLVGAVDTAARIADVSVRLMGRCPVSDSLEDLLQRVPPQSVIVDFTAPAVSLHSAKVALAMEVPLVIGTTGFRPEELSRLEEMATKIPLFWSSNMSIGISVMRMLLPKLAKALGPDYDMEIVELHHKHKKDAPSGTAITLGEALAKARDWDGEAVRCSERNGIIGERPHEQIGIQAIRGGDVVGVHTVYFLGAGERIEVTHHAHSRENFARGALRAAQWIVQAKPGKLYSMPDLLAQTTEA